MGFRILVNNRKVGALNLFSDIPDRFDTTATERAIVFAAFTSMALSAATSGQDVETLRHGLHSTGEIGKAVGMLMLLKDVTHEEAFDMLRRVSQEMNIKVAEVARVVVKERGQLPTVSERASISSQLLRRRIKRWAFVSRQRPQKVRCARPGTRVAANLVGRRR